MEKILNGLASLRLTIVALFFAMILVFVGTMAQVEIGTYAAQAKYFRSIIIFWNIPKTGIHIPVLPGGYLVGGVLLANLITSYLVRFELSKEKLGLQLTHFGLILLLVGQLASDLLQVESSMRLTEGEVKSYSEDSRQCELAILDTTDPKSDLVVAIPQDRLRPGKEITHPQLPFTVKVKHFYINSTNAPLASVGPEGNPATQGIGKNVVFKEAPPTPRMDARNVPSAYVELVAPSGSLGTWLASEWLDSPQTFTHDNKTYRINLRLRRYYKPFGLELLKFSHDKYMGTEIPKNFSSRVRILRSDTKEDREVLIYMNNPLRYDGETFYQSGYDERDPRITIFQVVRNPSWLTPYVACVLVGAGLTIQFLYHLFAFLRRRS